MHIFVVYAHPSAKSFSRQLLSEFIRGASMAGHNVEISDLYAMNFKSEMTEEEYLREVSGNCELPVSQDVLVEQGKILRADCLVFIYPLWWSDCPAKLKGWFDRVMTCGFAYFYEQSGLRKTRISVQKSLVICSAGHSSLHLEENGIAEGMHRIMLNDRLLGVGVKEASMKILGGILPGDNSKHEANLQMAYELGLSI